MKKKLDARKNLLPHSQAKVEFYKKYLERYLRILCQARHIDVVNIFDIFCGPGIYENEMFGSSLIAYNAIKALRSEMPSTTSITLTLNDIEPSNISRAKEYISKDNADYCHVEYCSELADELLIEIGKMAENQDSRTRNLVFIDPYGYKDIDRFGLRSLLRKNKTEIILFLPISHMQRFTTVAMERDEPAYRPLRRFVEDFFADDHPIRAASISARDYISYVNEALRFGRFFSTSYFIERDRSNIYCLFFISPHIRGFEKILEVKWELDGDSGRGFELPSAEPLLLGFESQERELQANANYSRLERLLTSFLSQTRTNEEVYRFVLENEFLPKHANSVFRSWQRDQSGLSVAEIDGKPARTGTFLIEYKPQRILLFTYNPLA